jgi:hypothetical protein
MFLVAQVHSSVINQNYSNFITVQFRVPTLIDSSTENVSGADDAIADPGTLDGALEKHNNRFWAWNSKSKIIYRSTGIIVR